MSLCLSFSAYWSMKRHEEARQKSAVCKLAEKRCLKLLPPPCRALAVQFQNLSQNKTINLLAEQKVTTLKHKLPLQRQKINQGKANLKS